MQTKEIVLVLSLVIFITMTTWQITTVYSILPPLVPTKQEVETETNYQLWKNGQLTGNTELMNSFTHEEIIQFRERYEIEREAEYQVWKAEIEKSNSEILRGFCVLEGCD